MEIDYCEYVRRQSRLVSKLNDIAHAMQDILFLLDDDLSKTIKRRNNSAWGAVNIVSNTLRDYEEELENVWKKYQNEKNRKGK